MNMERPQGAEKDRLRREAAAWVARVTSGDAGTDDAEELAAWRGLSSDHEAAYREAVTVWKAMGPALLATAAAKRNRVSRRRFLGGAAAATGVAAGLSAATFLGILPPLGAFFADYVTGRGEQRTVTLDDGSTVELDGDSMLSVAYSEHERLVTLSSGAAVFTVARDAARPFVVNAADGRTTALGTTFAVSHGADEITVDCLDGRIAVECRSRAELDTGQTVSYSPDGLGAVTAGSTEDMAAWRRGLLVFRDRSLADVVIDINRHRTGRVVIAQGELAKHRVSGVFHLDRPDEVIAHLEAALDLRSRSLAGVVLLY